MKKLTTKDWDDVLKKRPARRYIPSEEDGPHVVRLDSEIFRTERGEEDILGFVWDKDWNKVEAKATILEHKDKTFVNMPKIYSLGGESFSMFGDFITCCKQNDITPEDLPGSVFKITKTGDWTQTIEYIGRDDTGDGDIKSKEIKPKEISDDTVNETIDVIKSIKDNSPELVSLGFSVDDFLKVLSIRGNIKPSIGKSLIPKLEEKKVIKMEDDKIKVL